MRKRSWPTWGVGGKNSRGNCEKSEGSFQAVELAVETAVEKAVDVAVGRVVASASNPPSDRPARPVG